MLNINLPINCTPIAQQKKLNGNFVRAHYAQQILLQDLPKVKWRYVHDIACMFDISIKEGINVQ